MLRRKLLIMLAIFTTLMLSTALTSVLLMKGVLSDLESINNEGAVGTMASSRLVESLALIETEFIHWSQSIPIDTDRMNASVIEASDIVEGLSSSYLPGSDGRVVYDRLQDALANLEGSAQGIMGESVGIPVESPEGVFQSVDQMRRAILDHSGYAFESMMLGQQDVTSGFRFMAISLSVFSVVLINVSIFLLIRSAAFILKPVEQLLEASRRLAREEYSYRVDVGPKDEFAELAQGFNSLARNLEANEQRKIETLHQVARTLNHELNNAIAIIELQLRMVRNSSGYDQASSEQLGLIQDALHQMNTTVTSLTQVRRVVLTDYIKGVQMLDLKRSTQVVTAGDQEPGVQDGAAST